MKNSRSRPLLLTSIAVAFISCLTAYFRIFSGQNFTFYDDEGMLMLDLKRFLEGSTLYDHLSTIYGPFYYLYEWCAHALTGSAVTHDSVRFVSLFFWVTGALLVLLLVYRATGSLLLAVTAHFLAFRALDFIAQEPAHPQELCITLLAGFALAACAISRRTVLIGTLGVLAGAMAATKINLGAFAVIALTLALLFALRRGWQRSVLLTAAGIAALAFPLLLMWGHHLDWWAQKYCFVAVLSLGAVMLAVSRLEFESPTGFRDIFVAAAGFLASVVLLSLFPIAHGSSIRGMIDSLIIQPQRSFGATWFAAARMPDFAIVWTLIGFAAAILTSRLRNADTLVAALKLALAIVTALLTIVGFYDHVIFLISPFAWLIAVQPKQNLPNGIRSFPRALLALTAVIQILYAYPVAGAQVPFTAVMLIAVAAICFGDSLIFRLERSALAQAQPVPTRSALWTVTLLTVSYVFAAAWAIQDYREAEPVSLPGAGRIRLDRQKVALVRNLVGKIDASGCTMLASAPGLLSFNFLSGKPAPPSIDFSAWMLALNDSGQRKAVEELSREAHPCVLYNQSIIDFWTHGADVSARPLIRYMKHNFKVVYENSGYQFMEPAQR